ncbi:la-related protein 1C isoform X2 [Vitis riparia]|uniref:la-related protein 1C isoform X2 n=1 Tax=Vitis riparia TaxID=96939 RepID=UPI00155A7784|nr:la-related protein 1C isoform X2 [Vitis riparia]
MSTANSSAPTGPHLSPRYSPDGHSSPKSRRSAARGAVTSPWTQVVRGELESIIAAPSSPVSSQEQIVVSSDCSPTKATSDSPASPEDSSQVEAQLESSDNGNGNAGKRPAWNKPSNGVAEVGPVMGASSWPALSESARASAKSASDSLKSPTDGSISTPPAQVHVQGSGNASSPSHKQVNNNPIPSSTPSHALPTRQKSMKRGDRSGGSSSANAGLPQPAAPQGPVMEVPPNNSSPRDHTNRSIHPEGGQRGGFVPQSHSGNDYPHQRGSYRKGNSGPHSRGDGSHHHGYGGRRDQDRVNHDWNPHRNFNREPHMQPRVVARGFIRPPSHSSTQFIAPPHLRPFELASPVSQVVYVPAPHADPLRTVPFVAPMPHPMFFPPQDHQLHAKLVAQIDYYFSNENLIKDIYLRQNMDEQGWVPVKLIAGFKKVKLLTENIQLILEAVRTSTIVEVQGDKLRKRGDWMKWIMPPSVQFSPLSSPQSIGSSSYDTLAARFQNVTLGEQTTNHSTVRSEADVHVEAFSSRSSSGDLNSQSKPYSSEGPSQVGVQGGPDRSNSAKNFK